MSTDYNQYVPIDALIAAFGRLESANETWAKKSSALVKEISKSYKELMTEIQGIQRAASNTSSKGLVDLAKTLDRNVELAKNQKKMMGDLKKSVDVSTTSVNNLRAAVDKLASSYKRLESSADRVSNSQSILERKITAVTAAINTQIAVLNTASTTANKVRAAYNNVRGELTLLQTQLASVKGETSKVNSEVKGLSASANQLQKQIKAAQEALAGMGKAAKSAAPSIQSASRSMNAATKSSSKVGSSFRDVLWAISKVSAAIYVVRRAFDAMSSVVTTIDRMERLNIALENASSSAIAFSENQNMIRRLVGLTGLDIENTTRQYIKFTAATQGSKIEGEQANKIFQSFAKTFAALGASNITAERGLLAIEQMISKNTVGAEELRQQLGDALPGSVRLFTEAYKELHNMSDLTTGEFMKLMRDGKVLAEDLLPVVAKKLEEVYGSKAQRNLETISGSWTNLTNQVKLFLDYLNEDGVISKFFSTINNGIAVTIQTLRGYRLDDIFKYDLWYSDGGVEYQAERWKRGFEKADDAGRMNIMQNIGKRLSRNQERVEEIKDIFWEGYGNDKLRKEFNRLNEEIEMQIKLIDELTKKWSVYGSRKAMAEFDEGVGTGEIYFDKKRGKWVDNRKTDAGGGSGGGGDDSSIKQTTSEFEKLVKEINNLRDVLVDQTLEKVRSGVEIDEAVIRKWDELYATLSEVARLTGGDLPKNIRDLNEALHPTLGNLLSDPTNQYGRPEKFTPATAPSQPDPSKMKDIPVSHLAKAEETYMQSMSNLDMLFDTGRLRLAGEKYKNEVAEIYKQIYEIQKRGDSERNRELERSLRQRISQIQQEANAEIEARRKVTREAIKLASEAVNAMFEINKAFREAEIQSLQAQMEHDIEIAGDSEEKKVAIKKSYEKQMKQLRREQAKADKAQAVFSIGVNTGMAIANALATSGPAWVGIAMAAIVGAMGAIQLATVLAKPLPQFYKGTNYAPEGPAWVAEKGPELRESKGKLYLYTEPQITPLKRGDKIYTAEETSRILAEGFIAQEHKNNALQRSITGSRSVEEVNLSSKTIVVNNIDYDKMAMVMAKAVSERPVHEFILDDKGYRKRIRTKNSTIEYLNKIMP